MDYKAPVSKFAGYGDRAALHLGAATFTYDQLGQEVGRQHARLLAAGVRPGEIVFLQGDYSLEGIALFFALYQNANLIAMNSAGNAAEISMKVECSAPDVIIDVSQGSIERRTQLTPATALVQNLKERGRAGLILFSSGSTGVPKAMLHDLDNLVQGYIGKRSRALTILVFLLFDHIGGINSLLSVLSSGSTAAIPEQRTPDAVAELLQRCKVAILPTSPTFLNLMLLGGVFDRFDLSALRMITYGTEPMPEGLLQRLHKKLPGVKLLQTFGTSETGIVSTSSLSSDSLLIKINDPATQYKVVDGELWLHSSKRILGYLNAANDAFTEDGWFKTGDIVEEAADGFIRIKGRRKEIINVGGQKVFPAEVESALLKLPVIIDCKVYGETNLMTGQTVAANVVIDGAVTQDRASVVQAIRRFARETLDPFKVPARIRLVEEIPFSNRFKKTLR